MTTIIGTIMANSMAAMQRCKAEAARYRLAVASFSAQIVKEVQSRLDRVAMRG